MSDNRLDEIRHWRSAYIDPSVSLQRAFGYIDHLLQLLDARLAVAGDARGPSCAECDAVGTVFITEPSARWFRIVHEEGCPWAAAFAPRGVHEVCVAVSIDTSGQTQRMSHLTNSGNKLLPQEPLTAAEPMRG